ncbi:MAG: TIGR03560 family F420-dependent LLM class oxidoreductase [Chloroflexota bacterium]
MAQIGLMFEGQNGLTWQHWQRLLQAAEDFGYQCVFRSDHFTISPPYFESLEEWVSLTYAASHTRRIEFGSLVSPVTFRHPSLLVRMAAAVDDLSGGRLVLGMGAGWNEHEHHQFGIPFYDRSTRFEMFVDGLEITTRLLHQEEPVTYAGKHFSLDGAVLLPRPARAGGPPILIGGNGPKLTLPLVVKYADEWNGVFLSAADYKARNSTLTDMLHQAGRDPASVKRSILTQVLITDTPPTQPDPSRIIGTLSYIVDQINAYVESGAERIMLQWADLDDLDGIETLAKTVLPHFHTA